MHTGQHIFSRFQESENVGLETVKINLGAEESAVYVRFGGEITWDSLFSAEDGTLSVIRADVPVEAATVPKAEAMNMSGLKAKWDRIKSDSIRVVSIGGAATACSGEHVGRTGEIGTFLVTGFNGSPPNWEVRFTVHEARRVECARAALRAARLMGCEASKLASVFDRMRADGAALSHTLDRAARYVSIPWDEASAGGRTVYYAVLPGLPKELVSAHARSQIAAHADSFCLALMPAPDASQFLLLRGADVPVDLSGFLKKSPALLARGGGRPDWLNGVTEQSSVAVWLEALGRAAP
jgi:alanyl-tRNA synthetase